MTSKVSFTIRRPTPVSRATSSGPDSDTGSSFKAPTLPRHLVNDSTPGSPLARSNTSSPKPPQHYDDHDPNSSSDEDDQVQDELVTGFDQFGVQRCVTLPRFRHSHLNSPDDRHHIFVFSSLNETKKAAGPLVIPALKNRDWREMARKRRTTNQYVPDSAKAQVTGKDGSVGGLGTRDSINSGPVLSGLQVRKKETVVKKEEDVEMTEVSVTETEDVKMEKVELTEDELALRALLAGNDGEGSGPQIDIIPTPASEADAYKQDVDELPESATLDDYNRIPVSQFGAAMLRGMGWKEGTAASRKRKGIVEPYVPEARPALLGIGAKEMEVFDDGSTSNKRHKPKEKYMPIIKKDRDGNVVEEKNGRRRDRSRSPRRESRPTSRRGSPDRYYDDRRRDSDRRRDRDYDKDRDSDRRDRDRDWGRDRDGDRRDRNKDRGKDRDSRRDKDRDYHRDSSKRRD